MALLPTIRYVETLGITAANFVGCLWFGGPQVGLGGAAAEAAIVGLFYYAIMLEGALREARGRSRGVP